MDGLSAAASVIAVIQISSQVFDLCRTYYIRVKNARHDIQRLREDITSLQDLLISILDLAENEAPALSILNTIVRDGGQLQQCAVELTGLVAKLEPEDGKLRQLVFKAVKWPLSCKEVDNILVSIDRYKSSFVLALAAGQTHLSLEVGRNVSEIKDQLENHKIDQERENIVRWLTTTDPSTNLHAAFKNHQPGTGQWLLDSKTFQQWSTSSNSLLWLSGIPGCGKTTLSSTIIEHLQRECGVSQRNSAVAYFFFDFKATAKQEAFSCLSSIIGQLCNQATSVPILVKKAYARCHGGHSHPSMSELQQMLSEIIKEFSQVFIVIDALDECDINNERHDILTALSELKTSNLTPLHMLVTSRPYTDIENAILPHLSQPALQLQGKYIDSDIRSHILWQLATDSRLKRWPKDVKTEIQESLIHGANGMFRWVACQLDVLKRCLKVSLIRAALKNLPKTLDETYSRLFLDIDEAYRQEAKNALLWLSFSERPLDLAELAEGSIINPQIGCPFSPEERFPDPQYILQILSSLVVVSYFEEVIDTEGAKEICLNTDATRATISLAHLSVKEYLVSERIRQSSASYFATSTTLAHKYIAECSLYYILHWGWVDTWIDQRSNVPLLDYSSGNWHKHVNLLPAEEQALVNPLVLQLLQTGCQQSDMTQHRRASSYILGRWNTAYHDIENTNPLYYACDLGLFQAVKEILGPDWNGNSRLPGDEKPLFRAIEGGNPDIVNFLLERGVDPNAKAPHGSRPLNRAVDERHEEIVRVLLNHGALPDNNVGGRTALHSAVISNQPSIAHLLLDAGAEVNVSTADQLSQTPLHFAAFYRDLPLLDRLIKMGADVNAQNASGETALHYAAGGNHLQVMRMLLENGADPDIETEYSETPGAWAMSSQKSEGVELLVKYGAKVGISEGRILEHHKGLADLKLVGVGTEISYDREREKSWRYKDMAIFFNDLVGDELVEAIRPGAGAADVKEI